MHDPDELRCTLHLDSLGSSLLYQQPPRSPDACLPRSMLHSCELYPSLRLELGGTDARIASSCVERGVRSNLAGTDDELASMSGDHAPRIHR